MPHFAIRHLILQFHYSRLVAASEKEIYFQRLECAKNANLIVEELSKIPQEVFLQVGNFPQLFDVFTCDSKSANEIKKLAKSIVTLANLFKNAPFLTK